MSFGMNVLVTSRVCIDEDVFMAWLRGETIEDCAKRIQKRELERGWDASRVVHYLEQNVENDYQQFHMMQHYLKHPRYFNDQQTFNIESTLQASLVDRYYGYDDAFLLVVAGRKIKSIRNDLEELAAKTSIPLVAVRRQFQNFKRVAKFLDGALSGNRKDAVAIVKERFMFKDELAWKYTRIGFIMENRIQVPRRRALPPLNIATVEEAVDAIMSHWSCLEGGQQQIHLSSMFVQNIKRMHSLMNYEIVEQHKSKCRVLLSPPKASQADKMDRQASSVESSDIDGKKGGGDFGKRGSDTSQLRRDVTMRLSVRSSSAPAHSDRFLRFVSSMLKPFLRAILTIAKSLTRAKGIRGVLSNTMEKVIEPLHQLGMDREDVDRIFNAILASFITVAETVFPGNQFLVPTYRRLTEAVKVTTKACLSQSADE